MAGAGALLMLDGPAPSVSVSQPAADTQGEPPIVFEFWENLPSERVGAVASPPEMEPVAKVSEQDVTPPSAVADEAADEPDAADEEAADEPEAPLAAPAPLPPVAGASARVEFLVQAGAFRQDAAARKRQAELILAGMEAEIRSMAVDDGVLYRVIVGPFPTRVETRRVMGDLRARHIAPFLITRAVQPG